MNLLLIKLSQLFPVRYTEDITRWRKDKNLMFECQEQIGDQQKALGMNRALLEYSYTLVCRICTINQGNGKNKLNVRTL